MVSQLFFITISYLVAFASGSATSVQLPFIPITDGVKVGETTGALERDGKWWASIGNQVYHQPASLLGLSTEVSSYYYAIGSEEALSDDMKKHRVGGQGRWHIFHLPKGSPPSFLQQFGNPGDRRQSFSSLMQLESGKTITKTFPAYQVLSDYKNPLSPYGQEKEEAAVKLVTKESVGKILTALEEMPTRSFSNVDASKRAAGFIQQYFKDAGITSCLHKFQASGMELMNVVGIIPGKDAGSVTVGAHYDSRPFDGKAPGAEDNGSGVAALLAISSAYAKTKIQPSKTVYFVAFAGEEPGLLGSDAFANAMKENGEGIPDECRLPTEQGSFLQTQGSMEMHNAIIMDEVGWLSKQPEYLKPTVNLEALDDANDLMGHLAQASRQYNGDALAIVHNNAPFGSDHMSFSDRGIRAVLTINGDDEGYPQYHTSEDTIDNVDFNYVAQISKMDMGGLVRLSGVEPEPRVQPTGTALWSRGSKTIKHRLHRKMRNAMNQRTGLLNNVLDSIKVHNPFNY